VATPLKSHDLLIEFDTLRTFLPVSLKEPFLEARACRVSPKWLKISAEEIHDHIFRLARKGLTPSQIGVVLRDSHGVAQVKSVTGNEILRSKYTYLLTRPRSSEL
jgi:hypothetical protein